MAGEVPAPRPIRFPMMKYFLLISLLPCLCTGILKAEKTIRDSHEGPFEQPLIMPEKTRLSPAAACVAAYIDSIAPDEREKSSVPCLLLVKEVASTREEGKNGQKGMEWIVAEVFFQLNGHSVSLTRQLFQQAEKPVIPVDSKALFFGSPADSKILFSGSLSVPVLRDALLPGDTYGNGDPARAHEVCRNVFKNLKKVEQEIPSFPNMASKLRQDYMDKHPDSSVVPDVLLSKIVRDGYQVRAESLQNGLKAVLFSCGAEEKCLVANQRWMELIPLPEEDYFIVINHLDGHVSTLLLYRAVRWGNSDGTGEDGMAEAAIPEISVECVYRSPAVYDVGWTLGGWNYEGNVMRVVRRELVRKQGPEVISYDIPIR